MTDSPTSTGQVTVRIDPHDSLPDVLERIRSATGQAVSLEIPDHSPIFLTATEFRTLRDVADRSSVNLSVVTEDRLRLQLASMFGFSEREDRPPERDNVTLPSSPSFSGWRKARDRHTERGTGGEDAKSEADPIAESRRRRTDLYEPGVTPARARGDGEAPGLDDDGSFDYIEDEDARAARARLIGRLVVVVAAVLLAAGVAIWYFMPAVTVSATLRQTPVSSEVMYSVTAPGANVPGDARFAVAAEERRDTVEFEITVPATGVKREPDGTARGTVTLRNASDAAITLPAGSELTNSSGVTFLTDSEVEVPAGSADGSTIGEATVAVTAREAGSGGNLEQGVLTGKVADQPLYFSNRDSAMSGGSDREVKVVSEEDIAALETQVASDLRPAVAEGWARQLGGGQAVVAPSIEAGEPDYTIEQEAGDVSDTVTLRGTVETTGLVYDQASVEAQAREAFVPILREQVPEGYALDTSSIVLGEPTLLSEAPANVEYQVEATGIAEAVFDDRERDTLAGQLAGTSWSESEATLANVGEFESWILERSPGWWPQRMPQTEDRVTIEVASGASPNDATPTSSPQARETSSGDGT
jgi:hypothetical protein